MGYKDRKKSTWSKTKVTRDTMGHWLTVSQGFSGWLDGPSWSNTMRTWQSDPWNALVYICNSSTPMERQKIHLKTLRPASLRNTERSRNKKDPAWTRWQQVRTGSWHLFSDCHLSSCTISHTDIHTHIKSHIYGSRDESLPAFFIF